ncbi:MAG: acyltransferase family protein [Actinomycetaceae bacterium]|nr:acyltransferase family protein [Actinomycetaceae bacterium]
MAKSDTRKSSKRIATFDIAKGIGILAVIVGHMSNIGFVHWIVFSFHMPLFFLISGYFFRPAPLTVVAKKRARQLLVPYAVTGVAIACFGALVEIASGRASAAPQVFLDWLARAAFGSGTFPSYFFGIQYIGAIWFLLALYFSQVLYTLLVDKKYALPVVLALFVLGVVTKDIIWLPWSIQSALTCILFIHVGYRIHARKWFDPSRVPLLPFLIGSAVWVAVILIDHGRNYFASNYFENPVLDIAGGIAGTLVIMWLSIWISHIPAISTILQAAGRYSLVILCAHVVELDVMPWKWVMAHLNMPLDSISGILLLLSFKIVWAVAAVLIVRRIPLLRRIFNL